MSKIIVTKRKREANRRNAQNSTGPRTPEGKARSSSNATRHGLLALEATLSNEDHAEFEAGLHAFLNDLQPANILETRLIERLVSLDHKIRRAARIQAGLLAQEYVEVLDWEDERPNYGPPQSSDPHDAETWRLTRSYLRTAKSFDNLSRIESRLQRDFRRALQDLTAARRLREDPPQKRTDDSVPNPTHRQRGAESHSADGFSIRPSASCASGPSPAAAPSAASLAKNNFHQTNPNSNNPPPVNGLPADSVLRELSKSAKAPSRRTTPATNQPIWHAGRASVLRDSNKSPSESGRIGNPPAS